MKHLKPTLLHWQLRLLLPVTAVAAPVAALWTLHIPGLLFTPSAAPPLFILLHSVAIGHFLGRMSSPDFAYLHGRPFSRDTLWAHTMLASLLGALMAWLPAALIVWSGARSAWQDVIGNPNFPILAGREMAVPWSWLAIYGLMLPVVHYDWIRQLQPTRAADESLLLVVAFLFALLVVWGSGNIWMGKPGLFPVMAAVFTGSALALLIAGRQLYRRVEVRR